MNTNRKELTLDEMEQVNSGVLPILLGLGTIALGGGMIALFKDYSVFSDKNKKK